MLNKYAISIHAKKEVTTPLHFTTTLDDTPKNAPTAKSSTPSKATIAHRAQVATLHQGKPTIAGAQTASRKRRQQKALRAVKHYGEIGAATT